MTGHVSLWRLTRWVWAYSRSSMWMRDTTGRMGSEMGFGAEMRFGAEIRFGAEMRFVGGTSVGAAAPVVRVLPPVDHMTL